MALPWNAGYTAGWLYGGYYSEWVRAIFDAAAAVCDESWSLVAGTIDLLAGIQDKTDSYPGKMASNCICSVALERRTHSEGHIC